MFGWKAYRLLKMTTNKKAMSAWIWILIILILLAIGVGLYFWLSGGSLPAGIGESLPAGIGGSSIPQPPALPSG
jgi:uncharacterized membrane protein YczE